jgi:hypothetical protein
MVLVFDMVFSLLAVNRQPVSKQRGSGFIPETGYNASNFQAACGGNNRHTGRWWDDQSRIGECCDEFFLAPLWSAPSHSEFSGG